MNAADKPRAGRLDSLRAIAIVATIASHTIYGLPNTGDYEISDFGAGGVFFLFVLSSYLITRQLLEMQEARQARGDPVGGPLRAFYVKRVLRLFPAYYIAVIGAAIANLSDVRPFLAWHLAQLSYILFALRPDVEMNSYTGHFWSLGVEWQFYLLWPFVVFLAPRRALPWVLAGALIVGILCAYPPQLIVDRTNFLPSLDSLAIGGLLGYARHRGMNTDWLKRLAWPLIAFSFSSVLVYLLSYKPLQGVIDMPCFEALYVGFAGLICRAEDHDGGRAGRMLDWRPAQYVGRISYGAYVFHNFVLIFYFQMCWRFGVKPLDPGAPLFLLVLVLTLAAAAVSWELVERPINAFRTRFAYPPRQSPGAVAEAAQAG